MRHGRSWLTALVLVSFALVFTMAFGISVKSGGWPGHEYHWIQLFGGDEPQMFWRGSSATGVLLVLAIRFFVALAAELMILMSFQLVRLCRRT